MNGLGVEPAYLPRTVTGSNDAAAVCLVAELFPPAIGGSGVLLDNVYSRMAGSRVVVLTNTTTAQTNERHDTNFRIARRPIAWRRWGILSRGSLLHYWRVAAEIRSMASAERTLVHCARAVPEGLAALMARCTGGPRYLCWTHGEELVYARSSRELTFLLKRVHRGALALIANSRNTAGMLEAFGVPASKIHVVHPGVDAERFRPDVDGTGVRAALARPGETVLLSVGRLQRRKGHDLTITALASLRDSLPALKYVIVGDGEERSRLQDLVRQHGLGDRVTFVGEVSVEELPAYYAACDLFLMPNRVEEGDFEGFGIVFLEAAAAGRPVIGGRSGGVVEAVAEGETGLLVSGTDTRELATAISELVASPETRRRMGMAGRKRAVDLFTWDRAATAVSQLQSRLTTQEPAPLPART